MQHAAKARLWQSRASVGAEVGQHIARRMAGILGEGEAPLVEKLEKVIVEQVRMYDMEAARETGRESALLEMARRLRVLGDDDSMDPQKHDLLGLLREPALETATRFGVGLDEMMQGLMGYPVSSLAEEAGDAFLEKHPEAGDIEWPPPPVSTPPPAPDTTIHPPRRTDPAPAPADLERRRA